MSRIYGKLLFALLILPLWLPINAGACTPSGTEGGTPVYRVGAGCSCGTVQQAVNAIGFNGSGIVRIRTGSYGESLYIFNRSVSLIGGHASCTATAPSLDQRSTITAQGLNEQVVGFHVVAGDRSLSLRSLVLTEGDGQTGLERPFPGGGLSVMTAAGAGSEVLLDRVDVINNRSAFHGGGVALIGAGQGSLTLTNQSRINSNLVTGTEPRGGGLYCQGDYNIIMVGGAIGSNRAGATGTTAGRGGGVYVDGCNLGWWSHERPAGLQSLSNLGFNIAEELGGGLFATGGAQVALSGSHFVLIGAPRSTTPFGLNANRARNGAAIWAEGTDTRVTLDRAWAFQNSIVAGGSSIFVASAATIRIERGGSVCHHRQGCSRVFLNTGASLFSSLNAAGRIELFRTVVANNFASDPPFIASLFNQQFGSTVAVEDSLIHDNQTGDLFRATSTLPATLRVVRSTIASNQIGNVVFRLGPSSQFRLWDSIVHQPPTVIAAGFEAASRDIECVVWHDDRMGGNLTMVADPLFLNPLAGQFYLRENSPAINFCPVAPPPPAVDLDWNPRGLCHSTTSACGDNVYDLGALELPLRMFRDRFQAP